MRSAAAAGIAIVSTLAGGCTDGGSRIATDVDGGLDARTLPDAADATFPDAVVARDAAADEGPDTSVDAPWPGCNPNAPFGAPVLIQSVDTPATEGGPRLTADELTLYFSRGVSGSPSSLFVAHRTDTTAPFDPGTPLTSLDSGFDEYDPTTVTELTIYFTGNDRDGGSNDIFVATRASKAVPFGPPGAFPPLNSGFSDAEPFLRADESELWFASTRPGGPGGAGRYDIYRAVKAGATFASPQVVAELSSPNANEYAPLVSADGRIAFFASTRADGVPHIWTASRAQPTDPFSSVAAVTALNSTSADFPGWLSADGCRLYMSSTRSGNEDIYVATRGP